MLIDGKRALAYTARITEIKNIEGADNIQQGKVNGWPIIIKKGEFNEGDIGVFFEIDSRVPETNPVFDFLAPKKFKVKTMKLNKFSVFSQGLLMPIALFPEIENNGIVHVDVTDLLGIKYAVDEDNERKANKVNKDKKYQSMAARHVKLFRKPFFRWLMRREWGRKLLFIIFGKKKDNPRGWPTGKFPGVSKTDQERCENMVWILEDKTPWIRTQKCDGTSGTYILERKRKNKYEFYVCSRNVRMADRNQECFYGSDNYYWDAAIKYDIENKMRQYLENNPDLSFVCWQGEICGPGIQKNPHGLKELHLFCFHWTDDKGRYDIRIAAEKWHQYNMEVVPIDEEEYILPNDFEEFKTTADGYYNPSVCEGLTKQKREGYVYYSTKNPEQSFKNVSRKYLLGQE